MPTEPKPLLIRGDRLLLALDVLKFIQANAFTLHPAGKQRFSRDRVFAVIRRLRRDAYPYGDEEIARNVYGERAESVHRFLHANAARVAAVEFDTMPIFERGRDRFWDSIISVPLFRAIASGELTEENFQERGTR